METIKQKETMSSWCTDDEQFFITQNGTITTAKSLDRETQSLYNLVVMATNQAKPPENRLFSTVQVLNFLFFRSASFSNKTIIFPSSYLVTIILKDVNDMAPEFVTFNETAVMENIPINTVVMAIKTIDRDEGRNSYIKYSLLA